MLRFVGTVAVAALLLAACGGSEDNVAAKAGRDKAASASHSTATDAPATDATDATDATTAAPATTTTAAKKGTRTSPLPIGSAATVGDWSVTVDGFTPDATAAVKDENQFNDDPGPGQAYGLIHVKAVYNGTDKGSAGFGLKASFVGADNREYTDADCGAVEPDAMSDQPDVFPGGSAAGNFCILAPVAVTNGPGAIAIEDQLSLSSDAVWWGK